MLRRLLLYLSRAGWARNIVTHWGLARRMARRFVAGETLDEALAAARALNASGLRVTLDYLGESVARAEDTAEVVSTYRATLEAIAANGLQASVSLKLTHLGLDIDEALCFANLRRILEAAQQHSISVTIDMESSAYTDTTLRLYRAARDCGFDNVGTVIQAYLYRSAADMQALAAEGAHIRLCKGAYLEPPEIAYPRKKDVDASFVRLMQAYLLSPPPAYLCIATHDEAMIRAAEETIRQHAIPPARYEFQMLYGIRPARQAELAAAGHPTRIYVPFGSAWYPYFMRRLAERPANLWFMARSALRR
ncbi:MAG: proline dehydrogenase family protein [Aggregatilineales bacterium]